MTNSNFEIKDLSFDENISKELEKFYSDWPVVYILNNKNEMYIGETYHSPERMKQHLKNPKRASLKEAHVIGCKDFTKSATLDIESSLIELCSAIQSESKTLQNENNGIVKHNYHDKNKFSQESDLFRRLWMRLSDKGLVKGDIESLKNSDLFKYSPYKSLNAEQCTTRDFVIKDIKEALLNNEKRTIFVEGSAGTGKTILAIYLLKLLISNVDYLDDEDEYKISGFINDLKEIKEHNGELKVAYVVSMTSFRSTLKAVFRKIKGLKSSMVIGPTDVAKKEYDILIVDEAHRLKQRKNLSGDYQTFDATNRKLGFPTGKDVRSGNQLDWIVKQSKVQILFYDENQSIRPTDIDRIDFEKICNDNSKHTLSSQLRCMGGRDYIKYVKDILNGEATQKINFNNNYEFRMFENINDFCNQLLAKEVANKLVRIVAGYGFKWVSKKNKNKYDIIINDKKFYWNKKSKGWPLTIEGEQVVNEVGCIHTIQGYDLNYCGVIFGPEIIYRNGEIQIDKKKYFDIVGKKGIEDYKELKKYIINIYSVLMTRGIKGTYVYVCDDNLREYLKKYISI